MDAGPHGVLEARGRSVLDVNIVALDLQHHKQRKPTWRASLLCRQVV